MCSLGTSWKVRLQFEKLRFDLFCLCSLNSKKRYLIPAQIVQLWRMNWQFSSLEVLLKTKLRVPFHNLQYKEMNNMIT